VLTGGPPSVPVAANTPPPVQALGPHVAPLGVLYWPDAAPAATNGEQRWPDEYDGSVFVGEHG
jgi:glucose/arabinose dehydrogenase